MENAQYMDAALPARPQERHRMDRVAWLRAAVLGANDGIVSTSSLIVGVAAASASRSDILIAGTAGLVAGALSMAAGEYVSVSSQADTEQAELARERRELETSPAYEEDELAEIYVKRGVESSVARTVAQQLMARDALGAHARDELGLIAVLAARPLQAAIASASSFAVGALLPMGAAVLAPTSGLSWTVAAVSLIALTTLGGVAARAGGASVAKGAWRVAFWGTLAMVVTALVGRIFGAAV
jgi:VIT1/CCC1 family predicted Fe2+/Mn2+ transporter